MLPAGARLRQRADFAAAIRRGTRRTGRSSLLVVHLLAPADHQVRRSARAGFVVGRGVGNAVIRNRVRRRLRHLVADRLEGLPPGCDLVVRALPASAAASRRELASDLDFAVRQALSPRRQASDAGPAEPLSPARLQGTR